MMIKSISKISFAEQLSKDYLMEKSTKAGDIKRGKGYISVEELETYLEEYLVKNLPRFFAAYQEQDFEKTNQEKEDPMAVQDEGIGETLCHQNIMRSDECECCAYGDDNAYYVLGSHIRRREVISISFGDKLPEDLSVFEKYWDASEAGDGSVMAYAAKRGGYYEINICGVGGVMAPDNCRDLFYLYYNLQSVCFNGVFDTSQVTDMGWMFSGCEKLAELDVRGFDTSQVTDMDGMFSGCISLTELDVRGFDTSQVTDMGWMFSGCKKLTELDVRGFDTSQVTTMEGMFEECKKLAELDVRGFDTSQVTDMHSMFYKCGSLAGLDVSRFDTSNVINMSDMFYGCESLDERGFDTSNVTDMRGMFSGCAGLRRLDVRRFDTSKVTDMNGMFKGCGGLAKLDASRFGRKR